ncbi:MAG TPA: prephenate dehydrogenase/arogenate dehydrogenase family protein [Longimicrobium sp.]
MTDDNPQEIRSAAILGLGLIGGSLARDLHARGVRVFAWDRDASAVRAAMAEGIAEPVSWSEPVDAVILAVPVLAARDLLATVAEQAKGARLITDAGSTKASIVRAAQEVGIGARFVGSHPLAGDHRSGWDASRAGLFAGALVYLSPTPSTRDEAMRLASALWTSVGARPEVMDAADHDLLLAWTSHLPQMVSSALGGALAGRGIARGALGPGGRDVTRLAGSSPEMWADILLDNAGALVPALASLITRLEGMRAAIGDGDHAGLRDLLAEARAWHRQAP